MDFYFRKAGFRAGVHFLIGPEEGVFTYDQVQLAIEWNHAAGREVGRLTKMLTTGLSAAELDLYPAGFRDHAVELVDTFDRYGFLRELALPDPSDVINGASFWKEISALAARAKATVGASFYTALVKGHVSRGALIRYVVEYYRFVKAGPKIIAAMLPHEGDAETQRVMEKFLRSELGHDQMLLESLNAIGVTEGLLAEQPALPETFILTASFQVWASQEPLTFKALAFLLEDAAPDFHKAFAAACASKGLPRSFVTPIMRHASINDDDDHGSISRKLLSRIDVISSEERVNVGKQLAYAIESLAALEEAILRSPWDN